MNDESVVFLDYQSLLRLYRNGTLEVVMTLGFVRDTIAGSVDGALTTATAFTLSALFVTPRGTYIVADSATGSVSWSVIREVDPVAKNITRIAGAFKNTASSDPLAASLGYITAITALPDGNLILADTGLNILWAVQFASWDAAFCPAGYTCPCGTPQPCIDPAFFCPPKQLLPLVVTRGFYSTSTLYSTSGEVLFTQQESCPVGSFCVNGSRSACLRGSYGVSALQSDSAGCRQCPRGMYASAAGGIGLKACRVCPAGTFADSLGSMLCTPCRSGTASSVVGASNSSTCRECRGEGTLALTSLPGAAACSRLQGASATVTHNKISIQSVLTGAIASGSINELVPLFARTCLPLIGFACIPFMFLFVGSLLLSHGGKTIRCQCCRSLLLSHVLSAEQYASFYRVYRRIERTLEFADNFSLFHPTPNGGSPVKKATGFGGATTMFAAMSLFCLALILAFQYYYANSIASTSLLPASLPDHQLLVNIPPGVTDIANLPPYFPGTLQSGIELRITTLGAACDAPQLVTSDNILFGNFSHRVAIADYETLRFEHSFECPSCGFGPQSSLTISFRGECQLFLIAVASIGARGKYTSLPL